MTAPGFISANDLYTLNECKRRLHFGRVSFRALRAAGLRVLTVGRCSYVNGADLIALLNQIGDKDGTFKDLA